MFGGPNVESDGKTTYNTASDENFLEGHSVGSSEKPIEKQSAESHVKPVFSDNAMAVLKKRYLRKDDHGKVLETPEDMLKRIAANIASADLKYHSSEEVRRIEKEFYMGN